MKKSGVFLKIVAILLLQEKSFAHAMGNRKVLRGKDETKDYPDVSSQIMSIYGMTSAIQLSFKITPSILQLQWK